jgi:YXWGXW repeat-containing protein
MVKRFSLLASLTLVLAVLAAPVAQARTNIFVQIGAPAPFVAPIPVARTPYPGYTWQPGHFIWTRFGYRWVPGVWVRTFYPSYSPGRSERDHRDWERDRGYWNRSRDRDDDRGREGGDRR